ncbi:hypothetical protein M404DRAFT_33757 [Pisolithus tinctorius Marx 270]|uniref:Uncharacterized protein n=1 Tax=Pisolithus tinctorius Marx 270 TaxID=870435 RepID=A0A0C3NJX4_PISTI|nr:hypothetical protein M404DRAFT_33757 [Pisolithus tinctorius Marx 270]
MDSQYDTDNGYNDSSLTDLDDGGSIFNQGMEQSVIGDEDQESFDIDELEVLVCRQKDWKESGKMKKLMILQSILRELHELEKNRELSHAEMQLKAGLVTSWLKKPLHAWKPCITLWSGYKYSVQSMVWELYHDHIQRKLAVMRGDNEDGEGTRAIAVYQQALTLVIQEDLSDKQLAAVQDIADKWNGMEEPTPEMKARIDFNQDIADGTVFNKIHNIEGSWWEYLSEAFKEDRISTDEDNPHTEGNLQKKTVCTIKVDPVTLVMDADGSISIPEIEATYSTENLIPPPPPPPFEISPPVEELIPPPPPPVDTAEVAAKPEEIPPPPLPAEDIKDEDEDHLLLPPSSDDDKTDNDLTPPPPPSSEDCSMSDEPIPPPPLPTDESDSHSLIALPARHDLSDEEKAQMELDGFIHPGTDIAGKHSDNVGTARLTSKQYTGQFID